MRGDVGGELGSFIVAKRPERADDSGCAVVGSLWLLRDDEAEAVVRAFSREVARGRTLSASLATAQAARARAGAPAEAWDGLVVIGDGSVAPVPGGRGDPWGVLLTAALILVAVIAAWIGVKSWHHLFPRA